MLPLKLNAAIANIKRARFITVASTIEISAMRAYPHPTVGNERRPFGKAQGRFSPGGSGGDRRFGLK
jgi:hypothetical protein